MPRARFWHRIWVKGVMFCDPDPSTADQATSNAPAPAHGTVPVQSGAELRGQGEEAQEAFLQMMSNWFSNYVQASPNAQPPPPPPIPQSIPVAPQGIDVVRISKPPVDKIRKHEAEEFRAKRAGFWLENSMRVFDELSCTPKENLKCTVSLLKDSAYH
ncbi:Chaperone surA [Gossypium australe]|uniref:Chaperone surA n=1 Tax=Gossypium australe TaxID=47621 RepID=A0A5B6WU01_9ROSI|nr:Chaperone surA [Gossypium australe]